MPHRDKYFSFEELRRHEDPTAYGIVAERRGSDVLILSPHGGSIEPGVSPIVRAIAGHNLSYYLFEGRKKSCNYDTLHITSSRFEEPTCMDMLSTAEVAVAVHGCDGADPVVYLGGLDEDLINEVSTALVNAGYDSQTEGHRFPGKNRRNVCNLGSRGAGVQLELTRGLRTDLDLLVFAEAVRTAVLRPPAGPDEEPK